MNLLITALLVFSDAFASMAALVLTFAVRFGTGSFHGLNRPDALTLLVLAVFWTLLFASRGLYRPVRSIARFDEVLGVFKSVVWGGVVIFVATFDVHSPLPAGRVFLLTYAVLMFLFAAAGRMAVREYQIQQRWRGKGMGNALIVGLNPVGLRLYRQLSTQPVWGFRVVGFVDDAPAASPPEGAPLLGTTRNLADLMSTQHVRWLLVAASNGSPAEVLRLFDQCFGLGVRIMVVADYYQMVSGFVPGVTVHGLPLVEVLSVCRQLPAVALAKFLMDVLAGTLGTILSALLLPGFLVLNRLTYGIPLLVRRKVVGKNNRVFTLTDFAVPPGRWGRLLTRSRLYRLPEAWSLMTGRLSLVGPAPLTLEAEAACRDLVPLFRWRHLVKPGFTGWAQIRGTGSDTAEQVAERTKYDLYYIERMSLGLDAWIILSAVRRAVTRG